MKTPRLFRYPIDIIPVATVALAAGFQLGAVLFDLPTIAMLLVLVGCRQTALIQHNHAHLRIFYNRTLNEVFGDVTAFTIGAPLVFYEVHHVMNHHRHYRDHSGRQDWSSPYAFVGASYPTTPVHRGYYILTFPLVSNLECVLFLLRRPGSALLWRFGRTAALLTVVVGLLASYNPQGTLAFVLLPWLIVAFGLGANSYDGHVHCALERPETAARSCGGFHCRGLGYNIGYHIAHHMQPSLHWSRLPKLHREVFGAVEPPSVPNWGLLALPPRGEPTPQPREV